MATIETKFAMYEDVELFYRGYDFNEKKWEEFKSYGIFKIVGIYFYKDNISYEVKQDGTYSSRIDLDSNSHKIEKIK